MSTAQEHALESFGNPIRRKGTATHYANGKPKIKGKTQSEIKAGIKEGTLNSSGRPVTHEGLSHYTTDKSHAPPPKKDRYGWAGRVGLAHRRNQKAEHEKGYREDYR